jgi:dienelactone hydrolase
MRLRRIAAGLGIIFAGLAAPCGAAERPSVVREAMTIESHRIVPSPDGAQPYAKKYVSRELPVDVAVYRPDDGLKHPAVVYLHGGGMSFADPLMERFHTELASRGLVVLAPHYLLGGTGWPDWHETAVNTVTLAASLPSVDPDRIGMSGLSMGGQVGLSTAARDPRIKAVAEFFTAWPGSLPDEPIDKLPKVLLLNGTADPVIPFDVAMVLDEILRAHHLPFERHVYQGLGHGFSTAASFDDAVLRTAAFFGGQVGGPEPSPGPAEPVLPLLVPSGSLDGSLEVVDEEFVIWSGETRAAAIVPKKNRRRPATPNPVAPRPVASPSRAVKS